MRLSALIMALLLAAAAAFAACGGDEQDQAGAQPEPAAVQAADQQQDDADGGGATGEALKLGVILDHSGDLADYGNNMINGFRLAIEHLNEAGGVNGQPVSFVSADSGGDPNVALEEARRLIEVEGVHVIIGPVSSAEAGAIYRFAADARVPVIAPSSTSPQLCLIEDDDFLFRATLNDSAQGPMLAAIAEARGYGNVGVLYRDDSWGQGLFGTFRDAWTGGLEAQPIRPGQPSYLTEILHSARAGAEALVLIGFRPETERILQESAENGVYEQYVFSETSRNEAIFEAIGADILSGSYGASSSGNPEAGAREAWDAQYLDKHGALPEIAYVRKTYDSAIGAALAAQAAGPDLDGIAIRDNLRAVGVQPGLAVVGADAASLRAGLEALAGGGEVDYEGASVSFDFDECGDIGSGFLTIWRYASDGIEELGVVPYPGDAVPAIRRLIEDAGG